MTLLVPWIGVPLVVLALGVGCGLLIEAVAGRPLPGPVLVPLGLATVVVISQMTTVPGATARWTPEIVVVAAVIGAVLGRARLRRGRPEWWAFAAAAGVFVVFGAPVFLSGQATFASYTVSGDTSFQFVGIQYLLDHGRPAALPPYPTSTYQAFANVYYGRFYPAGAHTAAGVVKAILGVSPPWMYSAFLAALEACTALSLYALVRPFVASRRLSAFVAFIAAQPALALGYALQGQIKEVGAIAMIAVTGALVTDWAVRGREERGLRTVVPLAVAGAALIAVIGWAGAVWLAPLLLACLLAALWPARRRVDWLRALRLAVAFAVVAGVLAWPAYKALTFYFQPAATGFLGNQNELGNLGHPLSEFQVLGIWLSGDYRELPPDAQNRTFLLLGVALVSAAFGVAWTVRRRAWPVLLFIVVNAGTCLYLLRRGSPYADAKVFMIVSPAILLAVVLGVPALWSRGMRLPAGALAAVVGGGVLVSNALAYHDVGLAPRARFDELQRIDHLLAGKGTTLYTEFDEQDKFFLRDALAEGASDAYRPRGSGLALGGGPVFGFYYDLDAFPVAYPMEFRNVVLRRSPSASRPPSAFREIFRGRFYDVWQRGAVPRPAVAEHLGLGSRFQPGAVPRCRDVRAIAGRAAAAGQRLAFVVRPPSPTVNWAKGPLPTYWAPYAGDPAHTVVPQGPGTVVRRVRITRADRYQLWVQGSFRRPLRLFVDGRPAGTIAPLLNGPEQFGEAGTVALAPGTHTVTLERGGGSLAPGNGGLSSIGPLELLGTQSASERVQTIAPGAWRSLCGRELDWIERVGAAATPPPAG